MNKIIGLLFSFFLISCAQSQTEQPDLTGKNSGDNSNSSLDGRVIYGEDNRADLYQITDPRLLALSDSTVALVKPADITATSTGSGLLSGTPLGDAYGLCSTEPFREQITAAFCSGSLVGPDLILTAGHCITNATDCSNVRFVFGYAAKVKGQTRYEVPANEVYKCKNVIHTQHPATDADFAVVQIDRAVPNHRPLAMRTSGAIAVNDPVFVIGHPTGLPQKIAGGANVRNISSAGYFVTNLDTYGGNSGSPVFNANTLLLEGVLVRGENDYVQQGTCQVSNHCTSDACRGEDVTRISAAQPFIPNVVVQPTPGPTPLPTPVGNVETYSAAPQLSIPDNNATGITSSINVPTAPSGRKVLVSINILHSWVGDLVIQLKSPDGKVTVLRNKTGGNQLNLRGIIGEDISSATNLSALSKVAQSGAWSLIVTDRAARDVGKLLEWSVIFKP